MSLQYLQLFCLMQASKIVRAIEQFLKRTKPWLRPCFQSFLTVHQPDAAHLACAMPFGNAPNQPLLYERSQAHFCSSNESRMLPPLHHWFRNLSFLPLSFSPSPHPFLAQFTAVNSQIPAFALSVLLTYLEASSMRCLGGGSGAVATVPR